MVYVKQLLLLAAIGGEVELEFITARVNVNTEIRKTDV
jgi:hypothetical protein